MTQQPTAITTTPPSSSIRSANARMLPTQTNPTLPQTTQPSPNSRMVTSQSLGDITPGGLTVPTADGSNPRSSFSSGYSTDTHLPFARAIVLYDWDGIIPGRPRSLSLQKGTTVEICKQVNRYWYNIHGQDRCYCAPRGYLRVTGAYDQGAYPSSIPVISRNTPLPAVTLHGLNLFSCFAPTILEDELPTIPEIAGDLEGTGVPSPPFDE